jgi:hypothetical protein
MKIDRVIFCLNANKTYTSYWNIVSKVWSEIYNIKPTLGFVGTPEQADILNLSDKHGEIIIIPNPSITPNDVFSWSVTWALLYVPTLFPDDVCMTSGIDQIPLGNRLFIDSVSEISEDKFYVGFANAYGHNKWHPSSHLVAKGEIYKNLCNIEPDFKAEIEKIEKWGRANRTVSWGLDEWYLGQFLRNNSNVVLGDIFEDWRAARLCRSTNLKYDVKKIQSNYYSEIHAPRPYESVKDYIDKLVEILLRG